MKNHRFLTATILILSLMLACLAGCGSKRGGSGDGASYDGSERAGYYKLITIDNGEEVTDAAVFEAMDLQAFLVLNEDLTGRLALFGTEIDLTWNGETLTVEGEETPYTYLDQEIELDSDGSVLKFAYAGAPSEAPADTTQAAPATEE